jgi:parallel beta-helix repeat protein
MSFLRLRHDGVAFVVSGMCLVALMLHACGGGGSGGSTGSGGPPNTQPGQVGTPAPAPTATPTTVVSSGESLTAALKRAPAGSTVIVSPGTYGPVELAAGDAADSITLFADVTGTLTDSAAAPVVINAQGRAAAISLTGQSNMTIDGFTLRGALTAGLLVTSSPGTIVQNCVLTGNPGEGVRVQRSDGSWVFNNLVTRNKLAGVRVRTSSEIRVVNNTVYKNAGSGLSVESSATVAVENNIFDKNTPFGITVDPSVSALTEDFNMNNDGYRGVAAGPSDLVGQDPLFLFPDGDNFHVQAFDGGATSPVIDSGDPATDADLAALLAGGTTQTDGMSDVPPVDLGYHYALPPATPTPRARTTRTNTPRTTPPKTPLVGTPTPTRTTTPAGRPTRTVKPTKTPLR